MKEALIILGHGSKSENSNKQFNNLLARICQFEDKVMTSDLKKGKNKIDYRKKNNLRENNYKRLIEGAFLQFAEPKLETVCEKLVKEGVEKIAILPLFFFAGYHVRVSIPTKIKELKKIYPSLNFKLLEPIGLNQEFVQFIVEQIKVSF